MFCEATTRSGLMIETSLASPTGPLFALESGEGDLVVFLHGVTANAYVFVPLIKLLEARHHVVAIDQRGHGRSPAPPDGRYGPGEYAADVSAVIQSLGCGPSGSCRPLARGAQRGGGRSRVPLASGGNRRR